MLDIGILLSGLVLIGSGGNEKTLRGLIGVVMVGLEGLRFICLCK